MSKILFQRIVSLHAAASELAETIRLERLVDTGQVNPGHWGPGERIERSNGDCLH